MARLVALLRGINLGSKRRIAMADLRALIEELGYSDVRTVLASGNAVFTGPKAKARDKLEQGLAERFGFDVDVILRTMDELHGVVEADPFGDDVTNPTRYFVVFLDAAPDAEKLRAITEQDFSPDRVAAGGRELYAWCPDGMQDSRLMRELGKPGMAGTATVRNWSTVNKLLEAR
jgi:uncharacterized protein (DUF1697 family)